MDLNEAVVTEESYWEKWAKARVENSRVMKTTNVKVNQSFKRAQDAAREAVAAMKVAAEAEAEALYVQMRAAAEDKEIIIDAAALRKAKLEFEQKNREIAWFKAWEVAQTAAQTKADEDAARAERIAREQLIAE